MLHRQAAIRHRRAHGMIYLTVLVTSAIVMVVGVSALMAVRIQHHASQGAHRTAEARVHARSALELAMQRIDDDPDWRTAHAHDQWSDEIPFAGAVLRYKLVNVGANDLAADAASRVWLYGRAVDGQTQRTSRVLLQPRVTLPGANQVRNPRLDQNRRHWYTNSASARLRYTEDDARVGAGMLVLRDRDDATDGIAQTLPSDVRIESGRTYRLGADVRIGSMSDHMIFTLYTRDSVDGEQFHAAVSQKLAGSSWDSLSATITPTFTGTLEEARWMMQSADRTRDLFIDDLKLIAHDNLHRMTPVPGTWEQVVE